MSVEIVTLTAGDLEARFAPGAGMVGASLLHQGEEVLGQRGGLEAYVERGSSFGIPFLHPWANRLVDDYEIDGNAVDLRGAELVKRDPNGLSIHGLLTAWPGWQVVTQTDQQLHARADLSADPRVLAAFPFPHIVDIEVWLDHRGLTIATTVTATGQEPVPISFGFHPYLRVPGVPRAEWLVELPARRHLLVDAQQLPTGESALEEAESAPLGERTFDDGYDQLGDVPAFAVSGGGRRLQVRFLAGYPAGQVFAPPGQELICFEPMTAPTNALHTAEGLQFAAPGAPFVAAFEVGVSVQT